MFRNKSNLKNSKRTHERECILFLLNESESNPLQVDASIGTSGLGQSMQFIENHKKAIVVIV